MYSDNKQIENMKTSILTMADYNLQAESSMRFRNADGSLKKSGFVLKNHSSATAFRSLEKAKQAERGFNPIETVSDSHLYNYSL